MARIKACKRARKHRERLLNGFRTIRAEIEAFKPDFILLWGDDQYENFREDIIPPFCVMAYEQMDLPALPTARRQSPAERLGRAA